MRGREGGLSKIEINVKGLFATPVAAIMIPDAEARNEELEAISLRRRDEHPSIGASNLGGWHSTRDFLGWGGPRAIEVMAMAQSAVTLMTADRDGNSIRPNWTSEAWANVSGPGDSNSCHNHPGSFWSGAYYVNDGGCATDETLSGEFEMLDPRGSTPMMHAPNLKFSGVGALSGAAPKRSARGPG